MLSTYGKREWLTILAIGSMLTATCLLVGQWWLAGGAVVLTLVLLAFFRDPNRRIPSDRNCVVSPADGRVSSVHRLEFFEPFAGPATCVRVFLSVLDVHVNRSPCHCMVQSISHKPGEHLNALNPRSAEVNESNLIVLLHPTHRYPVAAVRQVAGLIARTIVCGVRPQQVLQRGQKIGMIKFGSTTELYLPDTLHPQVTAQQGQYVYGGSTILAKITLPQTQTAAAHPQPKPTAQTQPAV